MAYKEREITKLYHSIGEVSALLGVNPSLIRFWEKEFDILKPKKNKKGNRLFTEEDIQNLRLIFHLVKEKGYTLQGAKEKLKGNKTEAFENMEIINSLKKVREFLVQLKEEL